MVRRMLLSLAVTLLWIVASPLFAQEPTLDPNLPVEQTRKNIQALKGLKEGQLLPVMAYINASLGRNCEACHVKTGDQWAWDKDDKKAKQDARKMIQMTLDINKSHFNGRPQITCFTCHQGHERPTPIPALPVTLTAGERGGVRRNEPVPTAEALVDKYLEAIGGKAAIEKLSNTYIKGKYVPADGTPLDAEVNHQANKFLAVIKTPQGTLTEGFDGSSGWVQDNSGKRVMNPVETERAKSRAILLNAMKLPQPTTRLRLAGREKVGDNDAWVLRVQPQGGPGGPQGAPGPQAFTGPMEQYLLDVQTGLLVRKRTLIFSPIGQIPEQIDFEDYRTVDGVKIPFMAKVSSVDPHDSAKHIVTEIKHNVPLSEDKFAQPKEE